MMIYSLKKVVNTENGYDLLNAGLILATYSMQYPHAAKYLIEMEYLILS